MKKEYDFSKGVRGKFYKGAELRLPIYLNSKLQKQLERLALKNGKDIGEVVNQLVQKEVKTHRGIFVSLENLTAYRFARSNTNSPDQYITNQLRVTKPSVNQ
jgi:cytidylate kinase